jgi:lipopolysaccharide transport system permease protein
MGGVLVDDSPAIAPPDASIAPRREGVVLELTGEITPLPVLLGDLRRHWRLLPMLAAKEFHARYRSASFGVLWSVLLPLLQGAVLAVVFTHVVRIPLSGTGDKYPVFVVSGTMAWAYFSTTFTAGSTSIVDQGPVAGKVYFPRLILPAVSALSNLVSFAISEVILLGMMALFHSPFHLTLLLLPVSMLVFVALAIVLSALATMAHVYFRDVRYIVAAAILVFFYATPVIYPLSKPHGLIRAAIIANPATGAIQFTRWAIFAHAFDTGVALAWTVAFIVVVAVIDLFAYRRFERVACDRL